VLNVQLSRENLRMSSMSPGDAVAGGIRATGVDDSAFQSRNRARPTRGIAERIRSVGDDCRVSGAGVTG
jgi:hypothetical protein